MKLSYLLEKLQEQEAHYSDVVLKVDKSNSTISTIGEIPMNDFAQKQFLQNCLGIPYGFIKELTCDTANKVFLEKIEKFDRPLLLRKDGEVIRGVLSNRYKCLNHSAIVSNVISTIGDLPIQQVHQSNGYMSLRIGESSNEIEPSICINNSELGEAQFSISAMVYRLVCKNGLIAQRNEIMFSKKHMGNIVNIDSERLDHIYHYAVIMVESFKKIKSYPITNPGEEISKMSRMIGLHKCNEELVQDAYIAEPIPTGYGIVNAFTRAAQSYRSSIRDRIWLEREATTIMNHYLKELKAA